MKNLKAIVLAGAMTVSCTAFAQFANTGSAEAATASSYNRIGISYNNTNFGYNKEAGGSDYNFGTNGIGIDYIHGFNLSKSCPIFLELGINADFNFGSLSKDSEKVSVQEYWIKAKVSSKRQYINFQVPVNFGYRFNVTEDFSIAPYVGINFKLNVLGRVRDEAKVETNIPSNLLSQMGYDKSDLEEKGEWASVFSKDDMGEDYTWNRFQMGWHVGVGFQYKPLYLGIQYGTDFIPAFKYEKAKINTGNLKISLAYCF